jgi:exopolysaccharide biosynthesis WecB/TagA/CpsF family protein
VNNKSIDISIDNYDVEEVANMLSTFGDDRYGYVVTPNVDHIIRVCDDRVFRNIYEEASYVFLDSQFVAMALKLVKGVDVKVCRGSDLTERLLETVMRDDDHLVVVGSSGEQIEFLAKKYRLNNISHYEPPMGFIHDPAAVEECLKAIEAFGPFRFCFLAVGSPQQEILAHKLKASGKSRGLALCVGASIDFVTGSEKRAPLILRQWGLEWFYRLIKNPLRLSWRYLIRGPKIFFLFRHIRFCFRHAKTL